jgi:hypothetical protein
VQALAWPERSFARTKLWGEQVTEKGSLGGDHPHLTEMQLVALWAPACLQGRQVKWKVREEGEKQRKELDHDG